VSETTPSFTGSCRTELDPEVRRPEGLHHGLQLVLGGARDAHLVALDLGLHLPVPAGLDGLDDLPGGVGVDALRDADGAPDAAPRRRVEVPHLEVLDRHAALDQATLEHVEQGLHPELVIRLEPELGLGAVERDGAVGPEVVPLADLWWPD
jgi:hypothetical protein